MRCVLGVLAALVLTAPVFADPPVNDNFLQRVVFGLGNQNTATVTSTLTEATREGNERFHAGVSGPTVWWEYRHSDDHPTATDNTNRHHRQRVRIQATLNGQPAHFAVYDRWRFNQVADLPLAYISPDQPAGYVWNAADLNAPGAIYIVVTGEEGATGAVELTVSLEDTLVNDHLDDARTISGTRVVDTISALGWSIEPGIPVQNNAPADIGDVWWSWTAPATDTYAVFAHFVHTPNQPNLSVYTRSENGSLSLVDTLGVRRILDFTAVEDREYLFRVSYGYQPSSPITLRLAPAPDNRSIATAIELTGNHGDVEVPWNFFAHDDDGYFRFAPTSSGYLYVRDQGLSGVYLFELVGSDVLSRVDLLDPGTPLVAGRIYYLRIHRGSIITLASQYDDTGWLSWAYGPRSTTTDPATRPDYSRLRIAVLPNFRTVRTPEYATFFATILNPTEIPFYDCSLRLQPIGTDNYFTTWRRTDPSTNAPIGPERVHLNIMPNQSETVVFAVRSAPTSTEYPVSLPYGLDVKLACRNVSIPLDNFTQTVNRYNPTYLDRPAADVIAIAVTPTSDGVVRVPTARRAAFSVAAINIGAAGTIRVSAPPTFNDDGLETELCETNPATGVCVGARHTSVDVEFAANETRTFSVFVRDSDTSDLTFRPLDRRLMVLFTTPEGYARGGASVAVTAAE